MRSAARAGVLCLAVTATTSAAPADAQEPRSRTVLTIHQGAVAFPANPVIDAAIREALLARVASPIDYFTEYLEVDPLPIPAATEALREYIRVKYAGRRIDVVIAVTDQSLRFAMDSRAELFPDAPIVYMGIVEPDAHERTDHGGVTGVRVGTAFGQTLQMALALHPGTRRVNVVANSPNAAGVKIAREELRRAANGVPLVFLDGTVTQILEEVRQLPSDEIVLFLWHARREPGNLLYSDRIAELVANLSPVPVYGTSDFYIGRGLVGGIMRRTPETGARLGELAGRILNGERAQDLPIESAPLVRVVDWRQLQRWGIAESSLPLGSDVRFRVPSPWQAYRAYIVATIVIVSAQLVLIGALVAAQARAKRAEATVRARESTLRSSYDRIRHLAGRLIHAQEATRAAVARDLHDGVCQDLAGLSIAISSLKHSSGDLRDPIIQEELGKIQSETRDTYDDIRRLSHDLHPSTLRLLGLATALKGHCSEISKRHGVEAAFAADGEIGPLDPDLAVSLFRIAQESLRNAILHGKASHVSVSLARSGDRIELTVTDDGKGFDVEHVRGGASGLGLVSMGERAHAFGGDVRIASHPGRGTTIHVWCPAIAPITSAAG